MGIRGRTSQALDTQTLDEAFQRIRGEYNAATRNSRFRTSLTGVAPGGSGADYHASERALLYMRELWRDYARNNMVVQQGINRVVNNVLQDGMPVDHKTGNDQADALLAEKWTRWTQDAAACDVSRRHTFHRIAKMVLGMSLVDGDDFPLLLASGQIEVVEAHRVRTATNTRRNVFCGVLMDPTTREPLEYWFTKEEVDPLKQVHRVGDITSRPVRDDDGNLVSLHVFNPTRISQTRGIGALAAPIDAAGMHDDLQFANMVKAKVASCWTIIHNRKENFEFGTDATSDGDTARETVDLPHGGTRTLKGMAPGQEIFSAEGEEISGFSPNIPNPEFFAHAMMLLQFVAINLELPLAVLLLDPSKTNFSGWRGAVSQAQVGWRNIQNWMVERFYDPVYLWKVREWLKEDEKLAGLAGQNGVDIFGHAFTPPRWDYIEPNKDVAADTGIVKARLNSRRAVLRKRGIDIEAVEKELLDDGERFYRDAMARTEQIVADHPGHGFHVGLLTGDPLKNLKSQDSSGRGKAMEDIGRAVRSGVKVTQAEARTALGLSAEPGEGPALRFNDADVLEYHVRNPILTIDEVRARLGLPPLPDGAGQITPAEKLAEIQAGSGKKEEEGKREEASGQEEEEEEKDEGEGTTDEAAEGDPQE